MTEKDSYYSIEVEGIIGDSYFIDSRIQKGGKCSAEPTNFMRKDSAETFSGNSGAKKLVKMKYLLNQYGQFMENYNEKVDVSVYSDVL